MERRKICVMLAISLALTGILGSGKSYASEIEDFITGSEETIPVQNDVISETYRTIYANDDSSEDDKDIPDDVVKMVVKTNPVDENGNEAGGTETLEVTGESSMPDPSEMGLYAQDVVNMVMPVVSDETYDFVLDSQNLLSRYSVNKDSYEKSSLYFTNSTGDKMHTGISDPAIAKNKSTVPVLLYVTLQVENEYGWPVNYTDMDSVEADGKTNISFALIPVGGDDDDRIIYKDRMIAIDETGKAEMVLYLPGTVDNFDLIGDKYMAKEDADWSSLGFAITGACNTNANWSDINDRSEMGETLRIHVSYRMDLLDEEQEKMINNGLVPDPETGIISFDVNEGREEQLDTYEESNENTKNNTEENTDNTDINENEEETADGL